MTRPDSKPPESRILVVDDESFVREAIELYLLTEGFDVVSVGGGLDALRELEERSFDLAILDIMMPGMSGIELLGEIKSRNPDIEVVMASGCGALETAVEAMRMGAYDYVPKPILNFQDDLLRVITKALERRRLLALNRKLATDVQVVNRELKGSNSQLKRQMAVFDLLYDSGRMLAEIASRSEVLQFARQVLEYQFGVDAALILMRHGEHFRAELSYGIPESVDLSCIPQLVDPDRIEDPSPSIPPDWSGWLDTLTHAGESSGASWKLATLRSAGTLLGYLLVNVDEEQDEPKLRELFANQLAAPLALSTEEVTG